MTQELTSPQQEALTALLALRKVTFETNTVTRRSQNRILQSLSDADLTVIAEELSRHAEQMGW